MDEHIQQTRSIEDIPMQETMRVAGSLLKDLGVTLEMAQGILLAVSSSKRLAGSFAVWVNDNHPNEEQILHWIVEHT
jgi:hypothetical protein